MRLRINHTFVLFLLLTIAAVSLRRLLPRALPSLRPQPKSRSAPNWPWITATCTAMRLRAAAAASTSTAAAPPSPGPSSPASGTWWAMSSPPMQATFPLRDTASPSAPSPRECAICRPSTIPPFSPSARFCSAWRTPAELWCKRRIRDHQRRRGLCREPRRRPRPERQPPLLHPPHRSRLSGDHLRQRRQQPPEQPAHRRRVW
jgi:hypothetical protein